MREKNESNDKEGIKFNSRPTVAIDYERYRPYLEDADIPEDQKRELLDIIWNLMVTFVDLGFGIEPTQQAMKLTDKGQHASSPVIEALKHATLAEETTNSEAEKKESETQGADV